TGLRGARCRAEQGTRLHLELQTRRRSLQPRKRGDVHAHANKRRHAAAHGADRLPAGPEAGLWRRACRMETVLREAGSGVGEGRLKFRRCVFGREYRMNWNKLIRQTHRWLSIAFTVAVIANVVATVQDKQAVWVGVLALIPLILLLLSGL